MPTPVLAKKCNIVASPLAFGVYDPFSGTPVTSTATLDMSCLPARRPYVVVVDVSPPSNGGARAMTSPGGGQLLYDVYEDASHSVPFVSYSKLVSRPNPWTLTLYGKIVPFQRVPTGLYGDTITVTLLY